MVNYGTNEDFKALHEFGVIRKVHLLISVPISTILKIPLAIARRITFRIPKFRQAVKEISTLKSEFAI